MSSSPVASVKARVSNRSRRSVGRSRPAGDATSARRLPRAAARNTAARSSADSGWRGSPRYGSGPGDGKAAPRPATPASAASVRRSSATRSTSRSVATTTTSRGRPRSGGQQEPRAPGRSGEIQTARRRERPARRADRGRGTDAVGPGGHGFRMRSRMAVVERPGTSGTRTTRPPVASTSARPTIWSSGQSAPFASTSGRSASTTRSGVSSS